MALDVVVESGPLFKAKRDKCSVVSWRYVFSVTEIKVLGTYLGKERRMRQNY